MPDKTEEREGDEAKRRKRKGKKSEMKKKGRRGTVEVKTTEGKEE